MFNTAQCIGCGCTDNHACIDLEAGQPCHWIRVDYDAGLGVCSVCVTLASNWDAGDRTLRTSTVEPAHQETAP